MAQQDPIPLTKTKSTPGATPVQNDPTGVAVRLESISKRHRSKSGPVDAVVDVSLEIPRGQFVSLLGPSGCGKSTLLSIIGGLAPPSMGRVVIDGKPITKAHTAAGFVFQEATLLRWRSALKNVMLQAEAKGLDREVARSNAVRLLKSVGLEDFAAKRPSQLSGGMQQRVAICRALLHEPDLLLMDEPFSALDELTRDDMNLQLQQLWLDRARTVVFVTHSLPESVLLSDRVIVMSKRPGRVALDLAIDLPRPRTLDMRETPAFNAYVHELRSAL